MSLTGVFGPPGLPLLPRRSRRLFGRVTRVVAASAILTLAANNLVVPPVQAAPKVTKPEAAQRYKDVPGGTVAVKEPQPGTASAAARRASVGSVQWPAAATAEVNIAAARSQLRASGSASPAETAVSVPGAPLRVVAGAKGPEQVRVQTLSQDEVHAAGVQGVMFRVARTDDAATTGAVKLETSYGAFESAFGADWGSRLRLLVIPECHQSTPDDAACRPVPVQSDNNVKTKTVTGEVTLPAPVTTAAASKLTSGNVMVALAAGPSGGAGDFGATPLAPSSTWSQGGSSGGFSWNYPMRVPPAVNGPGPTVGLSYSSQSVDGRHAASNNQPGWVGEGFSYDTGFIERRYVGCADDKADDKGSKANNTEDTGDMCWATDNATMSLNGGGGELLKDAAGLWHPVQDDGSRIEKVIGGANTNGDDNGEYWKVTATDGTKYYFGRNRLPGWTTNKPETNSVQAVPVAGNHATEPCKAATFAASFCTQAYRWNLDYIEDIYGNTASLWYTRDTNYYAKNKQENSPVVYHRDAYPARIDYGTDNRTLVNGVRTDSAYTGVAAPAQVHFGVSDRCVTANCGTKDKTNWPDTPWDQNCASTGTCWQSGPSFWSSKRLTSVTTKVWKGSGYQDVDQWILRQSFPDPGDGTRAGLWLEGITHKGLNGAAVTLPEVTFEGIQLPNRVDAVWSDFAPAMNWWRITSIRTEAGAEIAVDYSDPDCVNPGRLPNVNALDSNTLRCYPVKWVPQGYTQPRTDYFHKYVVDSVQEIDLTAGGSATKTFYEYENPENLALWHWDGEDGLVQAKYKSWGQWRGYPYVKTKVGEGPKQQVMRSQYFRGMHGDKTASGTRTVNVTGLEGGPFPDYEQFAGMAREQVVYLDGVVNAGTVKTPWRSTTPAASRTINGVTTESRFAGSEKTATRALISGGQWRRFETVIENDQQGVPLKVKDLGNPADTTDDKCTVHEYLPNTDANVWLLHSAKRVRTWAGDCSAAGPSAADQVISDMRYTYDNLAYGATPTTGLVTKVERMNAWNGGNVQFQTIGTYKHDPHGRTTESTDIAGRVSKTDYSPATGGPLVGMTTKNPRLWETTVVIDPAHGEVLSESDINSRITSAAYDGLGRRTKVWYADRAQASNLNTPSVEYRYTISKTSVNAVETLTQDANGNYQSLFELYDGLLRPRQVQGRAVGGGRIIADTNFYDTAGRVWKTNDAYDTTGTAGLTLHQPADLDVPTQTRVDFDTAGRPIETALYSKNVFKWSTVTKYYGDYTTATPPLGGTASATFTDSHGQTTKLRLYHGGTPTGTYDETTYAFNKTGQLENVTDASGNVWSYEYDELGRLKKSVDPDKGAAEMTYNAWDQVETSKDAENRIMAFTYDDLGRLETTRDGSITGALRTKTVYDLPARGLTKSVSRFVGTDEYKTELVTADAMYRPTQTRVTLPVTEGFGTSYSVRMTYKADGSPNTVVLPTTGNLAGETLTYEYDSVDALPKALTTNYGDVTHYVTDATYTEFGESSSVIRSTALTGAPFVQSKTEYDDVTHRLKRLAVLKSVGSAYVADAEYKYDDAGNLIKIDDNPLNGQRDTQCFQYDHVQRLKQAWTPQSGDCSTAPASTPMGGPAPYWQEWDFGAATDAKGRTGSRLKEIDHLTPTGLQTTDYTYPAQGVAGTQPHLLKGSTLKNSTGQVLKTSTYEYDKTGNTTSRPGPNGQQDLQWDVEGHLTSVTDPAGSTSYVYDGAGNRLLAKDGTGATLYLGGGMELRLTGASLSATRFYSFNGEVVGQRTAGGIAWLCGDQQGTGNIAISADAAQTVTRRRQTPYGETRGPVVSWPNKKGYVGGDADPTGLVHLGAREYDPNIGRFISVDPLVDFGDPQQMHGYSYSNNNPITWSDPTGLKPGFFKGFLQGLWNSVKFWEMFIGIWKMLKDPKGAWNGLKGEAKKWEEKTGNFVMGWACAISGICDQIASCVGGDATAYDCGVTIGELAGEMLITALSGGAGLSARGAALAKKLAEKFNVKIPGLDTTPSHNRDGNGNGSDGDGNGDGNGHHDGDGNGSPDTNDSGGPAVDKNADKPKQERTDTDDTNDPKNTNDTCEHSFDPETPVVMAGGSVKAIKDVEEGDAVVSTDPATGATTTQVVTDLHLNLDTDLTDLTVADPATGAIDTLHTTQHHPFWDKSTGAWVAAADLEAGHELLTSGDTARVVVAVRNFAGAKRMRDLTVANIHTYYVVVGQAPVLVHNCGDIDTDDGVQGAHPKEHFDLTDDQLKARFNNPNFRGNSASTVFSSAAQQAVDYILRNVDLESWAKRTAPGNIRDIGPVRLPFQIGRVAHRDTSGRGNHTVGPAYTLTVRVMRVGRNSGHPRGPGASWVVYTLMAS
ncbi:RHS repeat-associated core domain-containing protein [Dactylosporangium sp. NPDC049742]|uniref:RHS repeat-associated core domain-containing protein n=1 Tax=Dactylosporangium sp. NPDC049742 TaxID=3154737 RepID=UPI00343DF814